MEANGIVYFLPLTHSIAKFEFEFFQTSFQFSCACFIQKLFEKLTIPYGYVYAVGKPFFQKDCVFNSKLYSVVNACLFSYSCRRYLGEPSIV